MTPPSARRRHAQPSPRPGLRASAAAALLVLLLGACQSPDMQSGYSPPRNQHTFGTYSFLGQSDGAQCLADWGGAPPLQPDLWDRIGKRYQFKASSKNERITTERNWYANHQAYLDRVAGRASRYLYHVANQLEERQLPGELALLPIVESAYNPFAYSRSQASGLWQFIPGTAKHLKMDMNWWFDERRDVIASTDSALDYLVFLRDHYDGDWMKAIAAYNAGWGTIDKAVAKNRAKGLPTDYWSLDVPAETRAYVPKLLALAQISRDPDAYGVHWAYIPDLPYFAEVNIAGQIDVARAADLAGINSDELYLLNPGINRWATPPGGPHRLLVPVDQADAFQERIASLPAGDRLQWANYTVQRGDSLNTIAKRFRTSPELIQGVNNQVPGQQLPVGTALLMPVSDHHLLATNPRVQEMEAKYAATQTLPAGSRSHAVKAGDTWWSIAKREGITASELQKLNSSTSNEPLKLGQKIALPGKAASASKATAANNTPQTADRTVKLSSSKGLEKTTGKTAYKVQSGDTLMAIARKHQLDVNDIARWNALDKQRATLKPGQLLTLYLAQR